jgi:CheY-like chemotaxis protein
MASATVAHCPVLIVEDDVELREMMAQLLALEGFQARAVSNGREALDYLGGGGRPHVILLDLMMPVMDGRGFREEQLKNPAWTAIPVIVISAYNDVDAQARALAVDHLRKPLRMRPLIEAVRRHCGGD